MKPQHLPPSSHDQDQMDVTGSYAAMPQATPQPLVGHPSTRAAQVRPVISPEMQRRHQESKERYPMLSLSAGEYVIEVVRRHPIGLLSIWGFVILLSVIIMVLLPLYGANMAYVADMLTVPVAQLPSPATLAIPALILLAFFALGGIVATIVYNGNRFYMTNESIMQYVQTSLFNTQQQVINLINVEDASSTQKGILQQVLNYGTLRLSTQGEKTVYEFHFVANPQRVVHAVNETTERAVMRMQGLPTTEF